MHETDMGKRNYPFESISVYKRDYAFDTIKGFLILLVVMGHALSHFGSEQVHISKNYVYAAIYTFHMPAFILISGYYSKFKQNKEQDCAYKNIYSLFLPFIIFHFLTWIIHSRQAETILSPGTTWYLLSLFVWKMTIPAFSKVRFIFPISLVVSLITGCTEAGPLLALSKTLSFSPFFVVGYLISERMLNQIRSIPKLISGFVLLCCFTVVTFFVYKGLPVGDIFPMKLSYADSGLTNIGGITLRAVALMLGLFVTFGLIALIPNKRTILSELGTHTITVYLGHVFLIGFTVKLFKSLRINIAANEIAFLLFCFLFSVGVCILLGNDWMECQYKKILERVASIILIK